MVNYRKLGVDHQDCYFWRTHHKAELDLLIFQGSKRLGFEFKYSKAPKLTQSMKTACDDLKLDKLTVIYAGDKMFTLATGIECIPLQQFHSQTWHKV